MASSEALKKAQKSALKLPDDILVLTAREVVTACNDVYRVVEQVVKEKQHHDAITQALEYCTLTLGKLDEYSAKLTLLPPPPTDDTTIISENLDSAEQIIKKFKTNCTDYCTHMKHIDDKLVEIKASIQLANNTQSPATAKAAIQTAQTCANSAADFCKLAQNIRELADAQAIYSKFETDFQNFQTKNSTGTAQEPDAASDSAPGSSNSAPETSHLVSGGSSTSVEKPDTVASGAAAPEQHETTTELVSPHDVFTTALKHAITLRDQIEQLITRCKNALKACDDYARHKFKAKDKKNVKCSIPDQARKQIEGFNSSSDKVYKALATAINNATQQQNKFLVNPHKRPSILYTWDTQFTSDTTQLQSRIA